MRTWKPHDFHDFLDVDITSGSSLKSRGTCVFLLSRWRDCDKLSRCRYHVTNMMSNEADQITKSPCHQDPDSIRTWKPRDFHDFLEWRGYHQMTWFTAHRNHVVFLSSRRHDLNVIVTSYSTWILQHQYDEWRVWWVWPILKPCDKDVAVLSAIITSLINL
jgi:hypothetical protein